MNLERIKIDGSHGEGGGQILRTSVALSALTGRPLTIENIRAGRKKPGLAKQHVCAIRSSQEVCQATVEGNQPGSKTLDFEPGSLRGGEFRFDIGSAGSCTLVAQTVLVPLMFADQDSSVQVIGGTHNPFAPPVDFLDRTIGPLLKQMGIHLGVSLERYGFYPTGGGIVKFQIRPVQEMKPIELRTKGRLQSIKARALICNLPRHIADRELDVLRRRSGWHQADYEVVEIDESGYGQANALLVEINFEHVNHVILELGKPGVRAEQVAARALKQAKAFVSAEVPVGEYLSDQLLLPMAIGASRYGLTSRFLMGDQSTHFTTHVWLLQQFLDININVEPADSESAKVKNHLVTVSKT